MMDIGTRSLIERGRPCSVAGVGIAPTSSCRTSRERIDIGDRSSSADRPRGMDGRAPASGGGRQAHVDWRLCRILGRLDVDALAHEPERRRLPALMRYCHAGRNARADADGGDVPLPEQSSARWPMRIIGEAAMLLAMAGRGHRTGCFQLDAAIQYSLDQSV